MMDERMVCSITPALAASMLPDRKPGEGKHAYGRLLGVLGSGRYRGAAVLAMLGAARSGVGLLSLAATEPVIQAVSAHLPECTFVPLREGVDGGIAHQSLPALLEECRGADAVLAGCGLGLMNDLRLLVPALVMSCPAPMVLDADALNILSENPDLLRRVKAPLILTPHHGEMARLAHTDREAISRNPLGCALSFAKEYDLTLVLKGSHTVVAGGDGAVFSHDRDNTGLGKGGSGDLLAGLIAGFLAQGTAPAFAAAAGVFVHGEAAALARAELGEYGMLPHDVARYLPAALKTLAAEKQAGQHGLYPC